MPIQTTNSQHDKNKSNPIANKIKTKLPLLTLKFKKPDIVKYKLYKGNHYNLKKKP
ncbi:hypothetical protein GCM10025777_12560 [Membranihabitans marinus]